MDDPFERHLRNLMQGSDPLASTPEDNKRLERVLHRAHIRNGLLEILKLFANWGWVISEGGARGLRHARPVRRQQDDSKPSSTDLNS